MSFLTKGFGALGAGINKEMLKIGKKTGAVKLGKKMGHKYSSMGQPAFDNLKNGDVFGVINSTMDIMNEATNDASKYTGKVGNNAGKYANYIQSANDYGLISLDDETREKTIGDLNKFQKKAKKASRKIKKDGGKLREGVGEYKEKLHAYDEENHGVLSKLKKKDREKLMKKQNKKKRSGIVIDPPPFVVDAPPYDPPPQVIDPPPVYF